jgi:hypothetical protein
MKHDSKPSPVNGSDLTRLFVGRPRYDDKIPVQFVFFYSGKRIHKLLTQDEVKALVDSGKYVVRSAIG